MNASKLRAWWAHRQGLIERWEGASPGEVLDRAGWARSVGGVGPYLTFFSRARLDRQVVDEAVARLEIHELPSTRGCTYVVPARDFGLALALSRAFSGAEMKSALKLGVTEDEVNRLGDAISRALAGGPLEVEAIRKKVGDAARSLGEEGRKKGISSTLPLALARLQDLGRIRRIPINGRLDQQRYLYGAWAPSPPVVPDARKFEDLARRFYRWAGPATLAEFRWFSALGAKAAAEAIAPLGLVPLEPGSDRMMFADDLEALHAYRPPTDPQYVLVSALDGIQLLRRDLPSLVDEVDRDRVVCGEKGDTSVTRLTDFPSHAILDRGRLIGFWEFDVDKDEVVWATFTPPDAALEAEVARTEVFVRDQLGDARSFSLDSPKSRAPRVAALRTAGLR
jgi:hypothetical protein